MSKKFISLLATVAMIFNLSIFSWGSMIPLLTETASAKPYETADGEEIVIYECNFNVGQQFDTGMSGAALATIGGWDKSGNAAFHTWASTSNSGSDKGFVPGSAPKSVNIKKYSTNGSSEYYIPQWARHNTGTYKLTFWCYRGTKMASSSIAFNDETAWNSATIEDIVDLGADRSSEGLGTPLSTLVSSGGERLIEMTINMDTNAVTTKSYTSTANYLSGTYEGSASGTWTRDYLVQISFRFRGGSTDYTAANNTYGSASMIDDMKLTYQKSGVTAHAVTGNIYATDFSTHLNTDYNYHTLGGWEIYYQRSGPAQGKDNTTGFAPFAAPYKESVNASDGAAYYLADDKEYVTGVYNVNFDMYIGADCSKASIYYHNNNDDLTGAGGAKVTRTVNNVSGTYGVGELMTIGDAVARNEWLNVDMTIDLDYRTWTWCLTRADGAIWRAWDGTWDGETLGAVEFYNDRVGTAVAAASNTNVTCNYGFVIDNFAINYYSNPLIYSEDFEHGSVLKYVRKQHEAGGWDIAGTANEIVSGGYNSANAFSYVHGDGNNIAANKSNSSEFYIPTVHVHDNGFYSLTFDLFTGNADSTLSFHLGDANYYDDCTKDMAFSKLVDNKSGHLNNNTWYKIKININLATGRIDSAAYDPSNGTTKAQNGEWYDSSGSSSNTIVGDIRHKLRFILFRGTTGGSSVTVPAGGGAKIDNVMIYYFGEGSNQKDMGNSFDGMNLRNVTGYNTSSGDRLGGSDWDLYNSVGDGSNHMVAGGVNGSAKAFAPVFVVGDSVNSAHSSEYWPDGDLDDTMGQWRIQHWFKLGSNNNNTERLDINDASTYSENTQETIYTFSNSKIRKGQWYHLDAVLDLDLHRKNIRITDSKGKVVDEVNGTISKDKLTYVSWYTIPGSSKTYTVDDCFLIDDFGITFNRASVDDTRVGENQGITFDDTNSKITYQAKVFNNLFIPGDENTKTYRALLAAYDDDDNLVFVDTETSAPRSCPPNEYWTTGNTHGSATVLPYSAINGGDLSGLTFRMFLWDWNTTTGTTTGRAYGKVAEATKE